VHVERVAEPHALAPTEEIGGVGEQMLVEGEARPPNRLPGLVFHTGIGLTTTSTTATTTRSGQTPRQRRKYEVCVDGTYECGHRGDPNHTCVRIDLRVESFMPIHVRLWEKRSTVGDEKYKGG
jgi:hypothetical protein